MMHHIMKYYIPFIIVQTPFSHYVLSDNLNSSKNILNSALLLFHKNILLLFVLFDSIVTMFSTASIIPFGTIKCIPTEISNKQLFFVFFNELLLSDEF